MKTIDGYIEHEVSYSENGDVNLEFDSDVYKDMACVEISIWHDAVSTKIMILTVDNIKELIGVCEDAIAKYKETVS